MAGETYLTVRGRLTADPEIRFTPSGSAVANFTVASNARQFDKQSNEWKDKPATFWRCAAWNQGSRKLAENVAETLKKGDSVILLGEVETRPWETKDGEKRSSMELRIEAVGKDLSWHAAPSAAAASNGTWTSDQGAGNGAWGASGGQPDSGWGAPGGGGWGN